VGRAGLLPIGLLVVALAGCLKSGAAADHPDAGPNLVLNCDFEGGTVGWFGINAEVDAEELAHSGQGALALCFTGDVDVEAGYAMEDEPDSVASAEPGAYRARAWVLAHPGSASDIVTLELEEDATQLGASAPVLSGQDWGELSLDVDLATAGPIGFRFRGTASSDGDCVVIDDVSLVAI
jgi:hypothetical protein